MKKKEEFEPWCMLCGKGFKTEEEVKEHYVFCSLRKIERLEKHNKVLEMKCLELQNSLRKRK